MIGAILFFAGFIFGFVVLGSSKGGKSKSGPSSAKMISADQQQSSLFSGHFEAEIGGGRWAPSSQSNYSLSEFAYKLAEYERELEIKDETDQKRSKKAARKFTVTTRYAPVSKEMYSFTEDLPFNLTRPIGSFDKEVFRVVVDVSGSKRSWKEKWTGNASRNATIRRQFTDQGLTVTYESGKGVYIKEFKRKT